MLTSLRSSSWNTRALSSVGQSGGLIIRWSQVQVLQGPFLFPQRLTVGSRAAGSGLRVRESLQQLSRQVLQAIV